MISQEEQNELVAEFLAGSDITIISTEHRSFPGERWLLVSVSPGQVAAAQGMAGQIEERLAAHSDARDEAFVVMFRPGNDHETSDEEPQRRDSARRGRLYEQTVDQLVQLLEARSRTSVALPSLRYVEDPRASLSAVAAPRHHVIYGRRGVGKTALLLEAKRHAEKQGHISAWINAHSLRRLNAVQASSAILEEMLEALLRAAGSSVAPRIRGLADLQKAIREARASDDSATELGAVLPDLNRSLKAVLQPDLVRLYLFLDDFYLINSEHQPYVLDTVAGALRDCDGWIKVASIERLSRIFEPSSRLGLEAPHDVSRIDLDVTLEDPAAAQRFLESVLQNYLESSGIPSPRRIAKRAALGRLVLASGGVPRDYLSLVASSIIVARDARPLAREIGREDVAVAAGQASQSKKRDLELDVTSEQSGELLAGLESLTTQVRGEGYTFFRVDLAAKSHRGYEVLGQLVDLRFAHLIHSALSDQHKAGVKYEGYALDLSEYSDVRLKRGLHVLDLEEGTWTWRLTGQERTYERLTGTQLRDRLRASPLVDVDRLLEG